jgi:peptide/nickel transport system substrate-binding protein
VTGVTLQNRGDPLSTPHRHRSTPLVALLAVLALVAAACGGDDGGNGAADAGGTDGDATGTTETTEARDEGEPQEGGSITVGLEFETANWAPSTGQWANAGYNVAFSIYDPLMAQTGDGDVGPYLAESLEANDDLTEWTLTLREGITFHDGTPLDAEVIAHNLEVNQAETSNLLGTLGPVERFEVTGELTGIYHLEQGNAAFPFDLTLAAGMPFSPTAHDADPEGYQENPVGTGPFRFVSWARDDSLVVERNEDYWQEGQPHLDRITFRPIPDEDTRFQSLLAGDIDAMMTLRQSIVRQALEADEEGRIEAHPFIGNNGGGAIFNTLQPPVDDVRVRRGLAKGIDQDAMVEVLGGTGITPLQTQYWSPDSPYYSEEVEEAWPGYDPDRAEELIEEYRDDPERSDGQPVGAPVRVEFNCLPDPSLIELAQAYQAYWGDIGVEVQLNQVEASVHISNGLNGEYMVNCWRLGGENDPYNIFRNAFGPLENNTSNVMNFHDEVTAEVIETLRVSTDFEERYDAVERIGLHFAEEVPMLWTGGTATVLASRPEVNGIGAWTLPDGESGTGVPNAVTRWGAVWVE